MLDSCPALVLNADFRPLSYFPLSLWSWQDAVKAVFLDRVNVVSQYDRVVRSPSFEMRLPSVIALKEYVPAARRPAFTRFNVFLRDRFSCQYCGAASRARADLRPCRAALARRPHDVEQRRHRLRAAAISRKGNRLPREAEMYPRSIRRSSRLDMQLQENGRAFPPNYLHESWRDFLYWDTELDPS